MLWTWLLKIQAYLLRKPKFKKWTELEDKKYEVIQAVEEAAPNLPEKLCAYLSTAFSLPVNYDKVYWKDTIFAFYKIHGVTSTIRKIPITDNQFKNKETKDPWDYSGRLFYLYANILASAYGWTQEQIGKLSVNDALAYIQEILTDRQLEKEFTWQTSEIAYPYDKFSKKSKFQPLIRPYWMIKQTNVAPKAGPPLPKSLLPVGNVIRAGGDVQDISK